MKLLFILFYVIVPFSIFNSCIDPKCRGVGDVYVSSDLLYVTKRENINYCHLVRKSLKFDYESVKNISLLQFYDGAGYEHGSVLLDIIDVIGEEQYIELLNGITDEEKKKIDLNLHLGLHFVEQRRKYNNTWEVKEAFPELYAFLNSNSNSN